MVEDYILMKIQKTLSVLNMQLSLTQKKTIRKVKKINKPYARKIQILTVIEQRSKFGGKPEQARLAKKAKLALKKKHGTSKKSKKS